MKGVRKGIIYQDSNGATVMTSREKKINELLQYTRGNNFRNVPDRSIAYVIRDV